jgi:signal peptidase I
VSPDPTETVVPEAPAAAGGGDDDDGPPPARHRRWLIEWGIILVVAVVVAVVVRSFVFQTFYIPSTSMYPTLQPGDRIVVYKLDHTVTTGEIVVFRRPPKENCGGPPVPDLVKRVIGLPGQTIQGRDGAVYIDGRRLAEPWLPKPTGKSSTYTANFPPIRIPAGHYFMMGDNRTDSCDSRDWGFLPKSYIVGKVVLRIWPLGRIALF